MQQNEKYSIKNILKNKNTWLIIFGYGLLWMVLVGIIYPLANLVRTFAFVLMGVLLTISHGSFTLPYVVFIFLDIAGAIIMFIPYKKPKAADAAQ